VTIVTRATAKVRNTSARVVIDGGGKVTLSGAGIRRILYMDTCDKRQVWTTSHCQDQANPKLTVQNITFAHGNSTGQHFDGGGGGAIFARGGQLKVVNPALRHGRCAASAALPAQRLPVRVSVAVLADPDGQSGYACRAAVRGCRYTAAGGPHDAPPDSGSPLASGSGC
jgi:hypothetical protein